MSTRAPWLNGERSGLAADLSAFFRTEPNPEPRVGALGRIIDGVPTLRDVELFRGQLRVIANSEQGGRRTNRTQRAAELLGRLKAATAERGADMVSMRDAAEQSRNDAPDATTLREPMSEQARAILDSDAREGRGVLSFDGFGINGPDEYRTRVATFADDAAGKAWGDLFERSPELASFARAVQSAICDAAGPGEALRAINNALTPSIQRTINRARVADGEPQRIAGPNSPPLHDEARRVLANILRAHLSGNNGAVMGEASLSAHFVSLGVAALGNDAAELLGAFYTERLG